MKARIHVTQHAEQVFLRLTISVSVLMEQRVQNLELFTYSMIVLRPFNEPLSVTGIYDEREADTLGTRTAVATGQHEA